MLTPLGDDDPREIGPYRIQSLIGRGGMGAVYLGFSPSDKAVAVKVPSPTLAGDEEFRGRFRREVDAARRVRGRAVAAVLDADTDGRRPWMATEYVEGASLAEAVAARGGLEERLVSGLAVGLVEALVEIHAVGVVHRDLKPANILMAWDGPRVIDFGVASASGTTQHTSTGMLVGTIVWMAPEQLRGERAGPAADIFAWGACVAYASAGRAPFHADNPQAIALKILGEPPDLAGVPASLLPMVRAALEKDPARRPSAVDLRDRLLHGLAAGAATRVAGDDRYASALANLWELPSPPPGPAGGPGSPYSTPPGPYPPAGHQHSPPPWPAYGPTTPVPAHGARPGTEGHPARGNGGGYGGGYGGPGYRDSGQQVDGVPRDWFRQPAPRPAPSPSPRRRRPVGTVVLATAFVLLIGGAVAAALALANRGGDGSPNVATSTSGVLVTPGSAASTGPSTGGGPSNGGGTVSGAQGGTPATVPTTPHLLTAQEVDAIVDGKGYQADLSTFDRTRDLNAVIGSKIVPGGNPDGSGATVQLAFVFANGQYIGTDTVEPSRHIEVLDQTPTYVVLEYATYAATDSDDRPSGTAPVRYNWDGKAFRPQNEADIPPADRAVDGSRR